MRKLLKANYARLIHDRIFLSAAGLLFLYGAVLPVWHRIGAVREGTELVLDFSIFTYAFFVPVLSAVLTAMFVGSDYDNGTLRNKIISGHGRTAVYLANLTVCFTAGVVFCLAYFIPNIGLGLLLKGTLQATAGAVAAHVAVSLALIFAFVSLFTLVAMLCRSKAHTASGCILLSVVLLLFGVYVTSALNEPEYLPGYSYTENGVTVEEPEIKNPNYIGGKKREVYEFLQDFAPGGQALQVADMSIEKPPLSIAYDFIILIISTGGGLIAFRRRDLR